MHNICIIWQSPIALNGQKLTHRCQMMKILILSYSFFVTGMFFHQIYQHEIKTIFSKVGGGTKEQILVMQYSQSTLYNQMYPTVDYLFYNQIYPTVDFSTIDRCFFNSLTIQPSGVGLLSKSIRYIDYRLLNKFRVINR